MNFKMPNLDPFYWGGRLLRGIYNFLRELAGFSKGDKNSEVDKEPAKKSEEEVLHEMSEVVTIGSIIKEQIEAGNFRKLSPDEVEMDYINWVISHDESKAAWDYVSAKVSLQWDKKVEMIKELREETGLGLKETKALIDLAERAA